MPKKVDNKWIWVYNRILDSKEKDLEMTRFGMFSDAGNAMIQGVVLTAKSNNLDWDQVVDVLYDIATLNGFEEASDTVVREMVYEAIQKG